MAINITIIKRMVQPAHSNVARSAAGRLPGWLWFIALWCFGVGSAMGIGFAFKLLMNATLFAVK